MSECENHQANQNQNGYCENSKLNCDTDCYNSINASMYKTRKPVGLTGLKASVGSGRRKQMKSTSDSRDGCFNRINRSSCDLTDSENNNLTSISNSRASSQTSSPRNGLRDKNHCRDKAACSLHSLKDADLEHTQQT